MPPALARRTLAIPLLLALGASTAAAQMPFYTDDPAVTEPGVVHFEFYNEYDDLHSNQFPNRIQNTANFKVNFGLPHRLEFDVDVPHLTILRALGNAGSSGPGDTNLGLKWHIVDSHPGTSWRPALATTFYSEFPTGNVAKQLGSGVSDYWLNFIVQEPLGSRTRVTANVGYLFAGNTATGVIGVSTVRGHVVTGGLSATHDLTSRLTLGAEAYGGLADISGLGRDQLQFLTGGSFGLRKDLAFTFAILGGKYEASPSIGGQLGLAVDLPVLHRRPAEPATR